MTNRVAMCGQKGVRMRPAEPRDLPRVLALFFAATAHMNRNGIPQWDSLYPDETTLRRDIARGEMYLLDENGAAVSAVVLNGEQAPEYAAVGWKHVGGRIGVIHRLCVSPARQGERFGKRTMLLAERELYGMGYRLVRLDAFSQNPAAIRLYESMGYRKAGEISLRKGVFHCYEKRLGPPETDGSGAPG